MYICIFEKNYREKRSSVDGLLYINMKHIHMERRKFEKTLWNVLKWNIRMYINIYVERCT